MGRCVLKRRERATFSKRWGPLGVILANRRRRRRIDRVQLREMRGPVPAYSAVYLFADGPDEPPCISRVDSSPGTRRGPPSDHPDRPAPDIGSRRTYGRRISFPSAYRKQSLAAITGRSTL